MTGDCGFGAGVGVEVDATGVGRCRVLLEEACWDSVNHVQNLETVLTGIGLLPKTALADEMPFKSPGSREASSDCFVFHLDMFLAICEPKCEQTFHLDR
jgi:hypothetical protein